MANYINWDQQVTPYPGALFTIPTYGNYGGPNYGDPTGEISTVDTLDSFFLIHDQAYGMVYSRYPLNTPISEYSQADRTALAEADKVVIEEIFNLGQSGLNSIDAKLYAGATMISFIEINIKKTYGAEYVLQSSGTTKYKIFAIAAFLEPESVFAQSGIQPKALM